MPHGIIADWPAYLLVPLWSPMMWWLTFKVASWVLRLLLFHVVDANILATCSTLVLARA